MPPLGRVLTGNSEEPKHHSSVSTPCLLLPSRPYPFPFRGVSTVTTVVLAKRLQVTKEGLGESAELYVVKVC